MHETNKLKSAKDQRDKEKNIIKVENSEFMFQSCYYFILGSWIIFLFTGVADVRFTQVFD